MGNAANSNKTKKFSKNQMILILGIISIVLGAAIHFPIFSIAPFLEYDPRDIPILLCTFLYGPLYGMALAAVSAVAQGLLNYGESSVTGILMTLLASWVCLWVAGNAYKINRNIVFALFCAAAVQTLALTVANMLFTPMFLGVSLQEVLKLIGPAVVPFNLIKCGLNGIAVLIFYKLFPHWFKQDEE